MRTFSLLALAAVIGCVPRQASVSTPADPQHEANARAAITATAREFSSLYERGDAAGMVAIYTPDGVILPPGRTALSGKEALTRYWTLAPGVRVLEHRTTADSIVVVGPVAYDWGTYHVRTQNPAGETRETLGKYVVVWRETSPGVWRMHVDMWNSAPAPR